MGKTFAWSKTGVLSMYNKKEEQDLFEEGFVILHSYVTGHFVGYLLSTVLFTRIHVMKINVTSWALPPIYEEEAL